jgi:hypothetical protein
MKTARSLSVVPEREAIDAAQSLSRPIIRTSKFAPSEAHKRMYELLGVNWVGHPDYVPKARHSFNPDIYVPARQDFLNRIAYCARVDRERNPAFRRAEAIRAAI